MSLRPTIALAAVILCVPAMALAQGAGGGHGKKQFLETYDTSGDSVVTRQEFEAQRGVDFKHIDADAKGDLNEAEYVAEYAARLDKELAEIRDRQITQAHGRFKTLDTDKNAIMTRKEFDESGAWMFGQLDTNKDGAVDEKDSAENF